MKIYIQSSIADTSSYEEVFARKVTRQYLEKGLTLDTFDLLLSQRRLTATLGGILDWKSSKSLSYHHFDLDTDNNVPKNIILIEAPPHGELHNESNTRKLMRHYHQIYPGYSQGRVAKRDELAMYKKLGKDLNFESCSALQIINALEAVIKGLIDKNYTSEEFRYRIFRALSARTLNYVRSGAIKQILDESAEDFEQIYDSILIDNEIASEVKRYLKSLMSREKSNKAKGVPRSKMHIKSLKTLITFMDHNSTSAEELRALYDSGEISHPTRN